MKKLTLNIDTKKIKTRARNLILVLLILGVSTLSFFMFASYSEGARVGNVVKISKKGVMFKTWEGQLNIGAITGQDEGGIPNTTWEFSVPKSQRQVLDSIDEAIENNKRVKLHYKQKYWVLPWRGDTQYMVYRVEILEK